MTYVSPYIEVGHINHPAVPEGGDIYADTKTPVVGSYPSREAALADLATKTAGAAEGVALISNGNAFDARTVWVTNGMRCGTGPKFDLESHYTKANFQAPKGIDPSIVAFVDGPVVIDAAGKILAPKG